MGLPFVSSSKAALSMRSWTCLRTSMSQSSITTRRALKKSASKSAQLMGSCA